MSLPNREKEGAMPIRIPKYQNMIPVISADITQQIYSSKRHYSLFYKYIFLNRLRMALQLIGNNQYDTLLDAGFGSGIFLPELKTRCKRLIGIDIHENVTIVKQMTEKEEIDAQLFQGNLLKLPFKDATFDCVVSISVLEFIDDTDTALSEIKRVSKRGAKIVIGAPILNYFTTHLYNFVGFKRHKTAHKSDQNKILNSAKKFFDIKKILRFPSALPLDMALFLVTELGDKK